MSLPNYPNNPTVEQTFVLPNGTVMKYDGEKWKALSSADNSLRSQLAAPDSDVLVGGVEAEILARWGREASTAVPINLSDGQSLVDAIETAARLNYAVGDQFYLITLESGYVLREQIVINCLNLSFIRIVSEDSVVPVAPEVWMGSHSDSDYTPAVSIRFGAVSPIFDVVFDAQETVTADGNKAGFIVRAGALLISSGQSTAKLGFKNLNGRGCYVFHNGKAQINFADFRGCFVGHRCSNQGFSQIRWGDVSNCASFGVMCDSSYINASAVTGNDCGTFAIATNNGNLMIINAVATGASVNSLQVVDGGKVTATDADFSNGASALVAVGGQLNANGADFSGADGDGIDARTGAIVIIPSANCSGRGTGVRARFGAKVEASNLTATGCTFGVIAENAEVFCQSAVLTGCGTGLYSNLSGVIRADGANVSGATSVGLNAASGGEIKARGVIANDCARPAQASAGGEIKMTGGSAINRTSQIRVLTGGIIYAGGLTTDSGAPALADFTGIASFNTWGANGVVYVNV